MFHLTCVDEEWNVVDHDDEGLVSNHDEELVVYPLCCVGDDGSCKEYPYTYRYYWKKELEIWEKTALDFFSLPFCRFLQSGKRKI